MENEAGPVPPVPPVPPPPAPRRPLLSGCLITFIVVALFLGATLVGLVLLSKGSLLAKDRVGVVEIKGLIADSRAVIKQLQRYERDPNIKAIVVRINSPGGAVGPSQEILREIEKVKKKKKVVASLGTLAASGGYYIACGANLPGQAWRQRIFMTLGSTPRTCLSNLRLSFSRKYLTRMGMACRLSRRGGR
jgi:hypothetical protein